MSNNIEALRVEGFHLQPGEGSPKINFCVIKRKTVLTNAKVISKTKEKKRKKRLRKFLEVNYQNLTNLSRYLTLVSHFQSAKKIEINQGCQKIPTVCVFLS